MKRRKGLLLPSFRILRPALSALVLSAALILLMAAPSFAAVPKALPAPEKGSVPPQVVKTFPEDGEEDAPLDARIMAVFNKKMREDDVNEFTVTLNDGVSDISATVRYNQELMKAVVTPLENLQSDHGYYVTVSRTVRDEYGTSMISDKVWKFKTIKKSDTNPPVIVDVSPTVSASGVPTDARVEVVFNKRMYEPSINENTIALKRGREKIVGAIRYFPEANKAVFSPVNALAPNSVFEVSISKEICDSSRIALATGQVYSFKTSGIASSKNLPSSDDENYSDVSGGVSEARGIGSASALHAGKNGTGIAAGAKIKKLMSRVNSAESAAQDDASDDIVAGDGEGPVRENPASKNAKIELVEMFPAPGAEMVNVDERLVVKFNKKMNPATFNIFNFSLQDGDEYVFGKVEFDARTNSASFTPAGNLKTGRKYRVTVSEKVEDMKGNRLGQNYGWEFVTLKQVAGASARKMFGTDGTPARDTVGPNVISVSPRENASSVPAETQLAAVFDEPVKDFSLNSFTFRLTNGENEVPGKIFYDTSQKKAIFTPKQPLDAGTAYTAQLTTGIMDLSGNYMQRERKWRFIVGKEWSGRGPAVTAMKPQKGDMDVDAASRISVTFDRKMKASTITPYSFFVTDGLKAVQGRVSYDEHANTAVFEPWSALGLDKTFTVTLAKTIEDREGQSFPEPVIWQFTTGGSLGVARTASADGATSVASGTDANTQIALQKKMGTESLAQMAERSPSAIAAKSELGSEMDPARPEKTDMKNIVPVADVKARLSVSDKGAYGQVAPKYATDGVDTQGALDAAPDEMVKKYRTSDKGAYGQTGKPRRINDSIDKTDVSDDAMNATLKDQISKFLSSESKTDAKLGNAVESLPSNNNPVADAASEGMNANIDAAGAASAMIDPAAIERANPESSESARREASEKYGTENKVYTRPDGIVESRELANPKSTFVQMTDPPSKEDSVNSDNPVPSVKAPRQPRLTENPDDDGTIKLEKAQKYGSDGREEQDADSPAEQARPSSITPPVVSAASVEPARVPAPNTPAAGGDQKISAMAPQAPPRPKGMINGVPIDEIMGPEIADASPQAGQQPAAPGGAPSQAAPAAPAGTESAPPAEQDGSDRVLKTHESGLSEVGPASTKYASQFFITAIYPNKNSENIKTGATVTAVFNRDADVASLNGTNFCVNGAEGAVNGKIMYNSRMKKVIFRPQAPLAPKTRYEVSLSSAIKTAEGQALMPLKWAFTTE